jgi:hypothetical protein
VAFGVQVTAAATHAKNLEALMAAYGYARAERDDARAAFVAARRSRNALCKAFASGSCATPDETGKAFHAARAAYRRCLMALGDAEGVLRAAEIAHYAAAVSAKVSK